MRASDDHCIRHRWPIAAALVIAACGQSTTRTEEVDTPVLAGGAGGTPATDVTVDTSVHAVGRVTSTGNSLKRTYNQYDVTGRVVAAQNVMGDVSYVSTTGYGYPRGTVSGPGTVMTAQTYPDGETVRYTYDTAGAPQSTTTTPAGGVPQTIVSKMVRNARGQTVEVDYGNQVKQLHCYNDGITCNGATGPNTDLRIRQIASTLGGMLQQYTYGYDGDGNVTSIADINGDASGTYSYDSLDRLTGGTFSYAYDLIGNLTTKEGSPQTYFASGANSVRPHALATAGGLTYTYDGNGNLSSRSDGLAITWNADNMPVQVTGGAASSTTLKYFVDEALWKKTQGSTTTYYLPALRVENGAPRKLFASFAERDPGDTSCSVNPTSGCLKFYHPDHLGSSTLITDAAGTVVHRVSYKPYGEDRATPVTAFMPTFQFTFKEKEKDGTGFYDYGARLYNPATGRWLSPDVAKEGNRYAYVRNNPLAYTDPSGHYEEPVHGALIYILAQAAGFSEHEAEIIAIASAGVDHDPKTQPFNALHVWEWHFSPTDGLDKYHTQVDNALVKGGNQMDLYELGRSFHTIADVNFGGPHYNGIPMWCVYTPCHPVGKMEKGKWSHPLNHHTDQAFRNPGRNMHQLRQIFGLMVAAAEAQHDGNPTNVNKQLANHAILQVLNADNEAKIQQFLKDTGWEVVVQRNNEQKVDPRAVQWTKIDYSLK